MLNNISIQGRLARDPEPFVSKDGAVSGVNITLANQKRNKQTQFIRCSAYGGYAENIVKWFSKGDMINIEGALDISTRKDDKGDSKTYTTIIIRNFHFCGGKKEKADSDETAAPDEDEPIENTEDSEELPF